MRLPERISCRALGVVFGCCDPLIYPDNNSRAEPSEDSEQSWLAMARIQHAGTPSGQDDRAVEWQDGADRDVSLDRTGWSFLRPLLLLSNTPSL